MLNCDGLLPVRLTMDCTDKSSILAAVNEIETQDGKLHILVNKWGTRSTS